MNRALLFAAVLGLFGTLAFASGRQDTTNSMSKSDDSMMKSDDSMKSDNAMKSDNSMKSDNAMMKAVSDSDKMMAADPMDSTAYNLNGLGPQVVAFTNELAAQNLARQHTVVYFFAATWCPDCMATYKDIKVHSRDIPSDLTIVFVDYDKAAALKSKYGVTAQHTFVSIGGSGEKEKVWNGSTTVADLVKTASPTMNGAMKSTM